MPQLIGIDFDNTLVCYDGLFHRICLERGLIPQDLPANKTEVRDYLRRVGKEDLWTEMQGYVYGARMHEAQVFPGVLEFFRACHRAGTALCIISHKTRFPFKGPQYDLHAAALRWLEEQGFFDPARGGLDRASVYFELTKAAKLARIVASDCGTFIDDLPEFLSEPHFPKTVRRILFDPNRACPESRAWTRLRTWSEAERLLL